MIRRPPRSTRTDTLFPYTTLFLSGPMPNKTVIPLNQSQLYKLTSPRRLADVLGLAAAELRAMATGPDRYRQFEIAKNSGGKRPVEDTVAPLERVQCRIAKILARL